MKEEGPIPLYYSCQSFDDNRGVTKIVGLPTSPWVQSNIVYNQPRVLRGMHWQKPPFDQAKNITLIKGPDRDQVFLHLCMRLSDGRIWIGWLKNGESVYVPKGFANGYYSEGTSIVHYLVDAPYMPSAEARFPAIDLVTQHLNHLKLNVEQMVIKEKESTCEIEDFYEGRRLAQ